MFIIIAPCGNAIMVTTDMKYGTPVTVAKCYGLLSVSGTLVRVFRQFRVSCFLGMTLLGHCNYPSVSMIYRV